ncbi:MAG: DUF21 domain-containing protein [Clostridiales bacterium]|nr:DUF21 domain-containing protein [Clostridiales bacterium]
MIIKKNMSRVNKLLITLLCILLFSSYLFVPVQGYVRADDVQHSSILEDFSVDKSFSIDNYPIDEDDYGLQVIQLAESKANELFIYVYQPCGNNKDLRSSSIRISTATGDDAKWLDYSLTYVGSEKTIYKYRVNNLKVKSEAIRFYDISSISRPWDKSIDSDSGTDMTINEKAFRVGQLWTVTTSSDGDLNYSMRVTDVVELTDLYANSIRYLSGHKFYRDEACDIFYVAFSADHSIDKLKEADIDFTYYKYILNQIGSSIVGPNKVPNSDIHEVAYLKADSITDYGDYSWEWIQSSSDFIKAEGKNLSASAKEIIEKQQWVLLYFGCEISIITSGPTTRPTGYTYYGYSTESVSVLRLKFEYNGTTYNLGVVSDKVTGAFPLPSVSEDPLDWFKAFLEWLKNNWHWIVIGVFAIIAIIVFAPFLPSILSFVVQLFVWLFKGIIWLIALPFRLIISIFAGGK